jgi:hypothetical protein
MVERFMKSKERRDPDAAVSAMAASRPLKARGGR